MEMIEIFDDGFDPNLEENYPPKGTPEECLIVAINEEQFSVLGHTGRAFHAQCNCAGFDGEEVGLYDVPDEPGFFVLEKGRVAAGDDYIEISGDWRPARAADFLKFDIDLPSCMAALDAT